MIAALMTVKRKKSMSYPVKAARRKRFPGLSGMRELENGILIVEFANQRKEDGLSVRDAVLAAATSRFRPILMTTLAMIFGTLPIALSLGTASGSRTSLGIAVVGGLIFAGVLTLYAIPAVYSYFSRPYVRRAEDKLEGNPGTTTPVLTT